MRSKLTYFCAGLMVFFCFFASGCGSSSSVTDKFQISLPYPPLTTTELDEIGASGFSGSAEAVAQAIVAWQDNRMKLVSPLEKEDVSYPMRWNCILPGIYPVSQMIRERKIDDSGTEKIYGVCWDFAAIFNAIAAAYGLESRISAWKKYMSGVPGGEKGLSPTEYNALKPKLATKGLNFTYEQVNAAARETYIHYRAEVKINGVWKAFDGTHPTGEYTIEANYQPYSWDELYDSNLAYK